MPQGSHSRGRMLELTLAAYAGLLEPAEGHVASATRSLAAPGPVDERPLGGADVDFPAERGEPATDGLMRAWLHRCATTVRDIRMPWG